MRPILRCSTALLLTVIFSVTILTDGCRSSRNTRQDAQSTESDQAQTASISIDDLVAPIALYPDQLLAQVLTASTNPQEVLDAGNWIIQNQNLKGDALVSAAKAAGFGPSMQYLMNFPQVIDNMCQEMNWTTQLGQAFQSDQQAVMEAVQSKRAQALQAGNLVSSPQMSVATKTENGRQYVEIKPTDPKVVYVPQYNPVTIYNTQATPAPTPVQTTPTTQKSGVSTGTAVGIGVMSFGVGMLIGAAIYNNNHYYPYPVWGHHGVYVGGHPYHPPYYHPSYPAYRPAYGYHPPPNYHWNQVNKNINVNVNKNYYNQFNNKNYSATPYANNRPAGTASVNPVNSNRPAGNSTYMGARPSTSNVKPGASMATAVPRSQQLVAGGNQPASLSGANANTVSAAGNRAASAGANGGGAYATTQPMNRGGDRGYANVPRPSTATPNTTAVRPSPTAQTQNWSGGGNAGAFAGSSAKADQAASSRGRSSMGGGRRAR